MEKQLEAACRAFPLDTAEPASDDDEGQRSMLLGRKAVSHKADQAEADRDQAESERESAKLRTCANVTELLKRV